MDDFESFINAIDKVYEAEDAIFNGYNYKINHPQFNLVNRSQYGKGSDFKHQIIEYRCVTCFTPSKRYCFIKCVNFLTDGDYKQHYLDFIRNGKRLTNITTMARIQPCLNKLGVNLGYYNGKEIWPRKMSERNIALKLHNNHFRLIWKFEGVSFNRPIKVLKKNLKS